MGQPRVTNEGMDKTIRKYASHKEMQADEYRYWQSRPVHERMAAVSELTTAAYSLKGMAPRCTKTSRTCCPPSTPTALSI
jgi:hypothetical protein